MFIRLSFDPDKGYLSIDSMVITIIHFDQLRSFACILYIVGEVVDTTNDYEKSNGYIFIYMACIGMEPVITQKKLGIEIN